MLTKDVIKELKNIVTSKNILTKKEELYVYTQDATNTKGLNTFPDVVVFVETIEQVQKILGHSQIDTTMQYAIVNQNNVKESHRKYIS